MLRPHTLQLVIKNGMTYAGKQGKLTAKRSSIVAHVGQLCALKVLLEDEVKLQALDAIRWHSEVSMIQTILRVPQDKLDSLDTGMLTARDRNILDEMLHVLLPFEDD